jgi:hypothetical protein
MDGIYPEARQLVCGTLHGNFHTRFDSRLTNQQTLEVTKSVRRKNKYCTDIRKFMSFAEGLGVCLLIVTLGCTSPWLSCFFLATTLHISFSVIYFVESPSSGRGLSALVTGEANGY